ncbi:hypothetical protein WN48_03202 [Eufriesea mexicana]|nr:hypothetical protein WN48_03202 [Eufriesea mexicana]
MDYCATERTRDATPIDCFPDRKEKISTTYHDFRCIRQARLRVAPKPAPICTAPSHH